MRCSLTPCQQSAEALFYNGVSAEGFAVLLEQMGFVSDGKGEWRREYRDGYARRSSLLT